MNIHPEIVCAGDLMVECIVRVPELPPKNSTLLLDSSRLELGGPAFNICTYFSNLGLHPRLVSPFGQRNRALIVEALSAAPLDDTGLIPIPGDTDFLITILTDDCHHSIYLRAHLLDQVDSEIRARCGHTKRLILAGSRHAAIRRAFLDLADGFVGDFLAFTPSYSVYEYNGPELAALLGKAHVTILNEQEAEHVSKLLDLRDYGELHKHVLGSLIVTLGAKGARVYQQNEIIKIDSCTASSSSAVGAGDAFFAGFLYETFRGRPLVDAARFGSVLAAFVAESGQVRVRVTEDQIRQRLVKHF